MLQFKLDDEGSLTLSFVHKFGLDKNNATFQNDMNLRTERTVKSKKPNKKKCRKLKSDGLHLSHLLRNHNTFQLRSQDPFSSFLMKEL